MPCFCRKLKPSPRVSSKSTPTKTTPFECMRCHVDCSNPASSWQGAHDEDQKLSTTALPFSEARSSVDSCFIPSAANLKLGAGRPFNGLATDGPSLLAAYWYCDGVGIWVE